MGEHVPEQSGMEARAASFETANLDPRTPDYNIDPREVPHYFDLEAGELIVGNEALTNALDSGANPETIHELGNLLLDTSIEIDPNRYPRLNIEDWTTENYLEYGRWLHRLTTPEGATRTNLTRVTMKRSRLLGLGASRSQITHTAGFGKITAFTHRLGLMSHGEVEYADWSYGQFVQYVVDTQLARAPGQYWEGALQERYEAREGPRLKWLSRHVGNPWNLLAERGYADVEGWQGDTDKAARWGGFFGVANAGQVPGKRHLRKLSPDNYSPGLRYTRTYFDNVIEFQKRSNEQYRDILRGMEGRYHNHLVNLRGHQALAPLTELVADDDIRLWLGLRVSAQYLLLDAMLPELPVKEKIAVATLVRQNDYLKAISGLVGPERSRYLQHTAYKMGLEADIWPEFNPEFLWLDGTDHVIPPKGEPLFLTPAGLQTTPMHIEEPYLELVPPRGRVSQSSRPELFQQRNLEIVGGCVHENIALLVAHTALTGTFASDDDLQTRLGDIARWAEAQHVPASKSALGFFRDTLAKRNLARRTTKSSKEGYELVQEDLPKLLATAGFILKWSLRNPNVSVQHVLGRNPGVQTRLEVLSQLLDRPAEAAPLGISEIKGVTGMLEKQRAITRQNRIQGTLKAMRDKGLLQIEWTKDNPNAIYEFADDHYRYQGFTPVKRLFLDFLQGPARKYGSRFTGGQMYDYVTPRILAPAPNIRPDIIQQEVDYYLTRFPGVRRRHHAQTIVSMTPHTTLPVRELLTTLEAVATDDPRILRLGIRYAREILASKQDVRTLIDKAYNLSAWAD